MPILRRLAEVDLLVLPEVAAVETAVHKPAAEAVALTLMQPQGLAEMGRRPEAAAVEAAARLSEMAGMAGTAVMLK